MRRTSAVVLPVPAAASTKKVVPNSVAIRRRASASASAVMARPRSRTSGSTSVCRLARDPPLFVGPAHDPVVAPPALVLGGVGGKKAARDRVADRLGDLRGRRARLLIERDLERREAAPRRAEIKPPAGDFGLAGEQLFGGQRIEQRLQRGAAGDDLAGRCRRPCRSCDR